MSSDANAPDPQALESLAADLMARALKSGADAAEAAIVESRSLELSVRDGELEDIERSESRDAGIRVFCGKRQAGVTFSDLSEDGCSAAIERAVAMAKAAPEDPYAGLADPDQMAKNPPVLELYEANDWTPDALEKMAGAIETSARAVPGVSMTESAFASTGEGAVGACSSNGFSGAWRKSSCGYGISVIAARDGAMERDYAATSARRVQDLRGLGEIGVEAGERTVARLGPKRLKSGNLPVVFDRRVSTAFLSALCGAISGPAVARGVSFLRDKMNKPVFAKGINIIDDPHRPWGFGSHPFDGEGIETKRRNIIEDGRLTTWFLNCASARQLGLEPNGFAGRNLGGPPGAGPSNLHLEAGTQSRADMIGAIDEGLLVTEMFGPSLNPNTGNWSVGVSGFRIARGKIDHPVSEITVAGDLNAIFARLIPADDLLFRSSINAPSVLVDNLAVGGA
tara:strand:- start:2123 stop:3484 length:1362 start_codon:yes stop_codon:yes gene_type:complete